MADISIDVSELHELAGDLAGAAATVAVGASVAVRSSIDDIVDTARATVEVDSGQTRDSIGYELDAAGLEAEAGPTTWWAHFVEGGTVRLPPRPFMGPALDAHTPDFVDAIAETGDRL